MIYYVYIHKGGLEKLTKLVNTDEVVGEMIASQIRNGELVAVAYTEIPLRYDEAGRLLRVEKEEAKSVARATLQNQTGKPSNGDSPNFYLVTMFQEVIKFQVGRIRENISILAILLEHGVKIHS